jgi:hypothetical protein
MGLGRALGGRFLLGGCGAPRLHLAAVESHSADFAAAGERESGGGANGMGTKLQTTFFVDPSQMK